MSNQPFYGVICLALLLPGAISYVFDPSVDSELRIMTAIAAVWAILCVMVVTWDDVRKKERS
jgi:hypothetical protein